MCSNRPAQEPSPSAAWRNWRQEMPLREKLRIGWANVKIKVIQRKPCCGHPGEPGC